MNRSRSDAELVKKGTLRLAREYAQYSQSLEKMLYAKWWKNPIWRMRRVWQPQSILNEDLPRVAGELSMRYKGILYQVFRRMGMDKGLENSAVAVWQLVAVRMRTADDHRHFSKIVWDAAISREYQQPTSLKPKFMLRQFVDEMYESDERGVLRTFAYGDTVIRPFQEALRILSNAYPDLHRQLQLHAEDISILTDASITPQMITGFQNPYVEYKQWLFDS